MIDCYTWTTDNGYKPRMMLEETGLPHKIIPVNIREKAHGVHPSTETRKLGDRLATRDCATFM
jgi:glutathione S-transferase